MSIPSIENLYDAEEYEGFEAPSTECQAYPGLREQILANARVIFRRRSLGTFQESQNIELIITWVPFWTAHVVGGPDDKPFIYDQESHTTILALVRLLQESGRQLRYLMWGSDPSQPSKLKREHYAYASSSDESKDASPSVASSPTATAASRTTLLKIERLAHLKFEGSRDEQSSSSSRNPRKGRKQATIADARAAEIAALQAELDDEELQLAEDMFAWKKDHPDDATDGPSKRVVDDEDRSEGRRKKRRLR